MSSSVDIDKLESATSPYQTDFSPYFDEPSQELLRELDLEIGNPESRYGRSAFTGEPPKFLAWLIASYRPQWSDQMSTLIERANSFLRKKSREHESWKEASRFSEDTLDIDPPHDGDVLSQARSLSRPARLHFMYALSRLTPGDIWHERGGNVLSDLTTYKLRQRGLDVEATTGEILSTGLLDYAENRDACMHFHLKDDLIAACEATGTDHSKSWRKDEILDALLENASAYLKSSLQEKGVVTLSDDFEQQLIELDEYADRLVRPCQLLFFA